MLVDNPLNINSLRPGAIERDIVNDNIHADSVIATNTPKVSAFARVAHLPARELRFGKTRSASGGAAAHPVSITA